MLEKYCNTEVLSEIIPSLKHLRPIPQISDREQWEQIPEKLKETILTYAENQLGLIWPELKATAYMENKRSGIRANFEAAYLKRRYTLGALVLAECTENSGRFTDDIINCIWSICEESAWCMPGAMSIAASQKSEILPDITSPIIDLFAAETAALLSWTAYLMGSKLDEISGVITRRIYIEIEQRILDPYIVCEEYFWLGMSGNANSNWNAWINSNCLAVFLIADKNEIRRIQGIKKTMECIGRFINAYPEDGGCDEGPNYWAYAGGHLFDYLDLLNIATKGRIDLFKEEKIFKIGNYINSVHISGDYFVNFADCPPVCNIPGNLMYRFGVRTGNDKLEALGLYTHRCFPDKIFKYAWISMFRALLNIFDYQKMGSVLYTSPYIRDSWQKDIQVMTAREQEDSDKGFFLAVKAGTNFENHNHNDVGTYCVYYNEQPVLIDLGERGYKEQHNSPQRYDIWNLQSAYHNLPTVNEVMQMAGKQYKASDVSYHFDDNGAEMTMDIASAYPESAGLLSWKRTCRLERSDNKCIEIIEDFKLSGGSDKVYISMMTAACPYIEKEGNMHINIGGQTIKIEYDEKAIYAVIEKVDFQDNDLLKMIWSDNIYRILFRTRNVITNAKWSFRIYNIK